MKLSYVVLLDKGNRESLAQFDNRIKPRVYVSKVSKSAKIRNRYNHVPIKACYRVVLCTNKLHFISRNWHKENTFSTVASGSSPIKIHYFVYHKRVINKKK